MAVQKLFTQGDFINTGNSLDLVIQGDGFFQLSRPDGTIAYTKAGDFSLDKDGRIVDPDGYPLEPPITIPSTATQITVAFNGDVNILTAGTNDADSRRFNPVGEIHQPNRDFRPLEKICFLLLILRATPLPALRML